VGTVFIVDEALEHTCGEFRAQAARGEISEAERDLLIDGAVLLTVNLEELIQDARAGRPVSWPDFGRHRIGPARPGRSTATTTVRAFRAPRHVAAGR
jgi:hypothetical protein